jgi:major membrane immunogen (membrane-anchored lipoprotein)
MGYLFVTIMLTKRQLSAFDRSCDPESVNFFSGASTSTDAMSNRRRMISQSKRKRKKTEMITTKHK